MASRIIEYLNSLTGTSAFSWLSISPAILYGLAIAATLAVFVRRCEYAGLSIDRALVVSLWVLVSGLAGARALYLVQHFDNAATTLREAFATPVGTASWGGYIGGCLGLMLYARRAGLSTMRYADAAASTLGLGIAIGRWSCFMAGDDFGKLSTLPWAVRYPRGSLAFTAQVHEGAVAPLADLSLSVHPVQLYLSVNGLFLFLTATLFWRRFRSYPGVTFWCCALMYSIARFVLEYFRGDQARLFNGFLTVPQLVAVPVGMLACFGLTRSIQHCQGVGRNPHDRSPGCSRCGSGGPADR